MDYSLKYNKNEQLETEILYKVKELWQTACPYPVYPTSIECDNVEQLQYYLKYLLEYRFKIDDIVFLKRYKKIKIDIRKCQ